MRHLNATRLRCGQQQSQALVGYEDISFDFVPLSACRPDGDGLGTALTGFRSIGSSTEGQLSGPELAVLGSNHITKE
jgi:hypothetical protein